MKNTHTGSLILVIVICSLLTACQATTPIATASPIPTEKPTALPPTAVPPTSEPSSTPTSEPTSTPAPLPTETLATSAESETTPSQPVETETAPASDVIPSGSAQLKASVDTNCRKYPMRNSNALGYLLAEETTVVVGKNSTEDWFYIPNPTNPGQTRCWVWSGSVELLTDLGSLVVIDNNIND